MPKAANQTSTNHLECMSCTSRMLQQHTEARPAADGYLICTLLHCQRSHISLCVFQVGRNVCIVSLQRVFPAMLQRALPQLGPPSRVKRLAQAHKTKQRRIPSAQQKMQTSGVAHRRPLTLEKWDRAIRQQVNMTCRRSHWGFLVCCLFALVGGVTGHTA